MMSGYAVLLFSLSCWAAAWLYFWMERRDKDARPFRWWEYILLWLSWFAVYGPPVVLLCLMDFPEEGERPTWENSAGGIGAVVFWAFYGWALRKRG